MMSMFCASRPCTYGWDVHIINSKKRHSLFDLISIVIDLRRKPRRVHMRHLQRHTTLTIEGKVE